MESRFFMEAKSFVFSMVDGKSDLWVEERRKGFLGAVCLGSLFIVWLVSKVEWVLRNTGVEDFVDSFREGSKAVIVRRGGYKAGRFLEVAVYVKGRDVAGWLALVDQSICDLGWALRRVKYGWKALGLGLKPILGPFCFKLPKAFKTRNPKRVLKAGLDLSSSCSTRRRKLHRLTTT
jgi:hypothetical protein